jgi:hypothetical protein
MDPFLELRWEDFHTTFCTYLRDAVNPGLPGSLRARVEERIIVKDEEDDDPDQRPWSYRPDAYVFDTGNPDKPEGNGAVATLKEPAAVPLVIGYLEPLTHRSLTIIDAGSGGQVISAIELLSPVNKRDRGLSLYLAKQSDYREGEVNLLELDLLLGGDRTTVAERGGIPPHERTTYHASLANCIIGPRVECFPIPLDKPLPRIPLPLRPQDPPIIIDLQEVFETTYTRGYYGEDIDYEAAEPAMSKLLDGAERRFVAERVKAWRSAKAGE